MDDDYPLLNTPNLVALILREAEAHGASAEGCADRLAALFGETPPALDRHAIVARVATHLRWLREARLLDARDRCWVLTERGRKALAAHPDGMDLPDLAAFPEFAAYLEAKNVAECRSGGPAPRATSYDEGFSARHEGAAFTDNPYDFGAADHQSWEKGWCEALDEDEGPGRSALAGGSGKSLDAS